MIVVTRFECISVTKDGMYIKYKGIDFFIEFEDCVRNFANTKHIDAGNCVGTRDISTLTFVFFSEPKTEIVFRSSFIRALFLRESAINNFLRLQTLINQRGYSSFDLS